MNPNVSGAQQAGATTTRPLLVIVGAGPKAAAIAAKARVLKKLKKKLKIPEVRVLVIESNKIGANWMGKAGFTTGQGELGTPPVKDVGFPYNSDYGSKVDKAMLEYSWQSYLVQLSETSYSDWIDRGQLQPKHIDWAKYLKWVLESVKAESDEEDPSDPQIDIMEETEVRSVEPVGGKLQITIYHKRRTRTIEADGIVLTGPGEPSMIEDITRRSGEGIFDGRNYWRKIDLFRGRVSGKIALIGGGETAASIALSLLDLTLVPKGPSLEIDIINRHGAIFTRGESYNENKYFSNPGDWAQLDEPIRTEFIQRTDRGVFSVGAQRRLDRAENVHTMSGQVSALEETAGDKVIVHLTRGEPPTKWEEEYDRVIVALGFNPWSPLKLFPQKFQPTFNNAVERAKVYKELSRGIDRELRLQFDFVPELAGTKLNVHMPMVAGLRQGPGFPNLSSLSQVSDRILSAYIQSSKPA